jgi:hypothetical protein
MALQTTIQLKWNPELIDRFREATMQTLRNALELTLEYGINEAKRILQANGTNVTERLQDSLIWEVISSESDNITGKFGSPLNYAACVENGTRPHFPPVSAIIEWVHKKGITGTYSVKTGRRTGSNMTQEQQDEEAAFAIAWHIYHYGTRAHPFLTPAGVLAGNKFGQFIRSEIEKLRIRK